MSTIHENMLQMDLCKNTFMLSADMFNLKVKVIKVTKMFMQAQLEDPMDLLIACLFLTMASAVDTKVL